ncbi:MAG: CRISPR-associated endonuclease Cas3'', partial [Limnochordia bacterium]
MSLVSGSENSQASKFWGKYDAKTGQTLSLTAHCIDVAVVFRELCNITNIRRALVNSTIVQLNDVHFDRLAVLAMFHDIGKANLGFQDKVFIADAPKAGHISELDPLFGEDDLAAKLIESLPHNIITWFSVPAAADSYFYAVFSHHGRPIRFPDIKTGVYWTASKKWWRADTTRDPFAAIADISYWAQRAFPRAFESTVSTLPDEPRFHHI